MTAGPWTLAGVAAYMLATLALGVWAGKDVEDGEDFMVAGRAMPRWLVTFTLFATWFGGGTCLGAAGKVYKHGLSGMVIDPLGAALCLLLSARFFFRELRRYHFVTVGDFFRARYGPRMELLTSLLTVPAYVGWVASQLVAFAFVIHTLTGLPVEGAIVVGTVIVLVYTALGGMWAVAVTDFAQALVLILGLAALLPYAWSAAGGWAAISSGLPAGHTAFLPSGGWLAWAWFLHGWVVIGLGDLPSQGLFSRALAAEDDAAAAQAGYAAALLYVTVGLIPVTLGLLGVLLVPSIADPEQVLLVVARDHLPPLLMALFSGALISALMSSADSALLAVASFLTENIEPAWRGRDLTGDETLRQCRVWVLVCSGAAMVLALYFQRVFELMVAASAVGLVGMMAPFVAGLYWPRANGTGAVASLAAGCASWLACTARFAGGPEHAAPPADLVAAGVSIVVLVVVSLATGAQDPPTPLVEGAGRAFSGAAEGGADAEESAPSAG